MSPDLAPFFCLVRAYVLWQQVRVPGTLVGSWTRLRQSEGHVKTRGLRACLGVMPKIKPDKTGGPHHYFTPDH